MEAAGVSPGLGQGTGAIGEVLQEVWQLVLQLHPGQALSLGPGHRVCPEVITQVPGQRVLVAPERVYIPVGAVHILRLRPPSLPQLLAALPSMVGSRWAAPLALFLLTSPLSHSCC